MAFTKITEYLTGIKNLPNRPSDAGITPDELKALFDARTDNEVKQAFNALIDELMALTAAAQLGAGTLSEDDVSDNNIQAKLMYLRAYADSHIAEMIEKLGKTMAEPAQAGMIGSKKVSEDDTAKDNVQAKLEFIKAYAEGVQKNLNDTILDPRVLPDGSVTEKKMGADVVRIHLFDEVPTSFPVLWLDTRHGAAGDDTDAMILNDNTSEEVLAEMDGIIYGVANASVNEPETTQKKYNFTII